MNIKNWVKNLSQNESSRTIIISYHHAVEDLGNISITKLEECLNNLSNVKKVTVIGDMFYIKVGGKNE